MAKVKAWIQEKIEDLSKKSRKSDPESMKEAREFLDRWDNELTAHVHFYTKHGVDLLNPFFKFYNFHWDSSADFDWELKETEGLDDFESINIRVDNIMLKIVKSCPGQDLLMCFPELMFQKKKNSRKLTKVLMIISRLYQEVKED